MDLKFATADELDELPEGWFNRGLSRGGPVGELSLESM
jgi:hypothetical protein